MDETACCSQGLEFVLSDSGEYPEYNPDMPINIEVCGTFNTYFEDNASYVHLENATINTQKRTTLLSRPFLCV
jgi:hypothetical protein